MKAFTLLFAAAMIIPAGFVNLPGDASAQTHVYAKQGFSMRLTFANNGTMGRVSYLSGAADPDSLGLEYPIGSRIEHILATGPWIGGKLDTARIGTSDPIPLVSTAFEGWAGPHFEFYPGSTPADTIWRVEGRGIPRPPGWEPYWGNSISRFSFSDNDHYCRYRDDAVTITAHVPLRLQVVQSSFVWNDSYAEGIHIVEYRITNEGVKQIDSAYVGIFLEHYVGRYSSLPYLPKRSHIASYPDLRMFYAHNTVDTGITPVGIGLLSASRDPDSLRMTFQWWVGPLSPTPDLQRYLRISSGSIMPDENPNEARDSRGLLAFGPFTIRPVIDPNPDTVVVAFGVVSAPDLVALRQRVVRAKTIYLSGGQVGVQENGEEIPSGIELMQNYPNPFNPGTTITYTLSPRERGSEGEMWVTLKVYDVLGREVATLVKEELKAGKYEVMFEPSGLSSGVYFYTLQADLFRKTRRMLLLR